MEWSYDQGTTWQRETRSSAVGAPEPPATFVTKFSLGHRLPPGLEAPGAGILPPTSAEGAGAAGGAVPCRTPSETPGSPLLPALRNMRPSEGLGGFEFQSRGQMVTTYPSEGAGAALQNRRVRHQRLTGPGTPTVPVSRSVELQLLS